MSARRFSVWAAGLLCAVVGVFVFAGVAGADPLPDGRIYEQVTPNEKHGSETYQPEGTEILGGGPEGTFSNTTTSHTFQAAADGNGIAFAGAPSVGGNEDQGFRGGNEYLARRSGSDGWTQVVLSPEGAPSVVFQAFSPSLATAFVNSLDPLSPVAPGYGEPQEYNRGSYDVLYSMNTESSESVPFFSARPPYRSMQAFGTAGLFARPSSSANSGTRLGHPGFLAFEGASADDTHLLFAANDALTGASDGRPPAEGGNASEFEEKDNLYESFDGQLRLVNVLPNGTTKVNATYGGIETASGGFHEKHLVLSHAISADGSRIFWTDLGTGHVYMREDGVRTVEISPAGTYRTATSDGSTVFYTNGDLYAYNVETAQTTDLTPGVSVEKVLGASEDGRYVYYVTDSDELELWHDGASTLVRKGVGGPEAQESHAEVTPDGHGVVFTVSESLSNELSTHVYVYDADGDKLYCASCTSAGTKGTLQMTNNANVYQPRWISANGTRVFFVSRQGLVPQDTNEGVLDVYEWERAGSGDCAESFGCVYLLSGGTSTADSSFLDASENGDDAFIVTRAKLVSGDQDDLYDVYDVRVGNASATPPACTGTGCQGIPSPPPIFATPSSVTFEGVGNFGFSAQQKGKPKASKNSKSKKKKKKKGRSGTKKQKGKSFEKSMSVRSARAGTKGGRS